MEEVAHRIIVEPSDVLGGSLSRLGCVSDRLNLVDLRSGERHVSMGLGRAEPQKRAAWVAWGLVHLGFEGRGSPLPLAHLRGRSRCPRPPPFDMLRTTLT